MANRNKNPSYPQDLGNRQVEMIAVPAQVPAGPGPAVPSPGPTATPEPSRAELAEYAGEIAAKFAEYLVDALVNATKIVSITLAAGMVKAERKGSHDQLAREAADLYDAVVEEVVRRAEESQEVGR